jgi:hypothetical protein
MVNKIKAIIDEVVDKIFAEIGPKKVKEIDVDAVWKDVYEQVTDELNHYLGINEDYVAPITPPLPKTDLTAIKKQMKAILLQKMEEKVKR